MSAAGRLVTVAATQFACGWELAANLIAPSTWCAKLTAAARASSCCRSCLRRRISASNRIQSTCSCTERRPTARCCGASGALAAELEVVLPVSFFERAGNVYFNSLAMLDADGRRLGIYRKSHIPNGPGYQEKFYFSPGDTGFRLFDTRHGRIGAAICWDQWFPESARIMALMGAELLLYPTAIGSEPPPASPVDSRLHWQRTQQGHAAANLMPLIASNRIGTEYSMQNPQGLHIRFYGSSFIADASGALVAEAPDDAEA